MKNMKSNQKGFTLIELVVVIVILGILAATALPKFVDLSDDAEKAALQGIAGALSSAASINYAGCSAVNHAPTAGKCVEVKTCADAAALIVPALDVSSATPAYTVTGTAVTTKGADSECTIKKGATTSPEAKYTIIGAGF